MANTETPDGLNGRLGGPKRGGGGGEYGGGCKVISLQTVLNGWPGAGVVGGKTRTAKGLVLEVIDKGCTQMSQNGRPEWFVEGWVEGKGGEGVD